VVFNARVLVVSSAILGAALSASGQNNAGNLATDESGHSPQYSLLGCKWIVSQIRVTIPTALSYYPTLKTGVDRTSAGYWTSGQMEVVLNSGLIGGYTPAQRYGLAAHEFGHALGLGHNNSRIDVLMYGTDARTVGIPQADDRSGVNAMYP